MGVSLIEELIAHDIYVTAVCRENSQNITAIPQSPFVKVLECNLDQLQSLERKLSADYDVFYHFGWMDPLVLLEWIFQRKPKIFNIALMQLN